MRVIDVETMMEKKYKTRKLVEIARNINGAEFEKMLKFLKNSFPGHQIEAYAIGKNRYVIRYNLNYTELEWLCNNFTL